MPFSDYVIFADESGDHSPNLVSDYPLFVLAFCIFEKSTYVTEVVPSVQQLKFDFFGHDDIILHESDIHRKKDEFRILSDQSIYQEFMQSLSSVIADSPFEIVASIIDKRQLAGATEVDLYDSALHSCLERTCHFLDIQNQMNRQTHLLVEARGKKEDRQLRDAFNRFRAAEGGAMSAQDLCIRFPAKQTNSIGMQLADLVARPIGLSFLRPNQQNRAVDIIKGKLKSSEQSNPMLERISIVDPKASGLGR